MIKSYSIKNLSELKNIFVQKNARFNAFIVTLPIHKNDVALPYVNGNKNIKNVKNLNNAIKEISEKIPEESILFIYGSPLQLIKAREAIPDNLKFRYWIAIDLMDGLEKYNKKHLKHNHVGILMLTKGEKYVSLNTKNTRIPHIACSSCGKNIKDWGGKKHLMNIRGIGVSDVWRDFLETAGTKKDTDNKSINLNVIDKAALSFKFNQNRIGKPILDRLCSLVKQKNHSIAVIEIDKSLIGSINKKCAIKIKDTNIIADPSITNKVILGDCIEEMERLSKKYPHGVFDLIFADPPYNLNKQYKAYNDTLADKEYLKWCDKWLELCARLTKPTGSIFILNIPKWALKHATTLNKYAYLQNWIVWDALSAPKGKIMPAHYALLYYTKSPIYTYNYQIDIDSPEYCLRANCINTRKKIKFSVFGLKTKKELNNTIPLSDIWWDVYRIKHKKNRDDHPCQLPDKLMDRIIKIFSNENDLVFDPFGGAGTTAIRAIKNKRKYTTIEIDPYYKDVIEKKLKEIEKNGEVIRKPINKSRRSIYTKRGLELKVQELSGQLGRKPTLEEFTRKYSLDANQISILYEDPKKVLKAGRIGILNYEGY